MAENEPNLKLDFLAQIEPPALALSGAATSSFPLCMAAPAPNEIIGLPKISNSKTFILPLTL